MTNRRRFLVDCTAAVAAAALFPVSTGAAGPGQVPLDAISFHAFAACQGSVFWLQTERGALLRLELAAVEIEPPRSTLSIHGQGDAANEKFRLLFRGPHNPAVESAIHALQHHRLGTFSVFLAPVLSLDPAERCYEAVFNRAVPSAGAHGVLG